MTAVPHAVVTGNGERSALIDTNAKYTNILGLI
jgi:hypothetical protein